MAKTKQPKWLAGNVPAPGSIRRAARTEMSTLRLGREKRVNKNERRARLVPPRKG